MNKMNWTPHLGKIEKMIVDGMKLRDIAKHFGVNYSNMQSVIDRRTDGVRRIRAKHGIFHPPFVRNGFVNWGEPVKQQQLIGKIQEGLTVKQMADYFGVKERALMTAISNHTPGLRVLRRQAGLPITITENKPLIHG